MSDTEADQLLAGMPPAGHPDLVDLARAIAEVRTTVTTAAAPTPSVSLFALLEGQAIAPISRTSGAAMAAPSAAEASSPSAVRSSALIGGVRRMNEWITGLGLASKIAIGTAVVLVAATGVGAAGALPGPAQSAFDTIVSTVTGEDSGLEDDPAPYVDDESDVDVDAAPYVDDESDADDDPAPYVDDESGGDDDAAPYVDDESGGDDDAAPYVDDESDVDDDAAPSVDDDSDVDDEVSPTVED